VYFDVLSLYLLKTLSLVFLVLPILIEVREAVSDIIYEQLREFFVVLDDVAEELAEAIVDDVSELLLEREGL
jgi:hypothetical protein